MNNDNDNLDELELQLIAQLNEIKKKKALLAEQERIKKELEVPMTITVRTQNGIWITIDIPFSRPDFLDYVTTLDKEVYKAFGYRGAYVNYKHWNTFVECVSKLPNINIKYDYPDLSINIQKSISDPAYKIDVTDKSFIIRLSPIGNKYKIGDITSATFNVQRKYYEIAFSEGWRIFDALKEESDVVYTAAAGIRIKKQIEQRSMVDKVATLDEVPSIREELRTKGDYGKYLGDNLRNFQTVGVAFGDYCNDRYLIADEMGLGKTWQALARVVLKDYKKVLVICPASLRSNWGREIRALTGEVSDYIMGTVPQKYDMAKLLTNPSRFTITNYDAISRPVRYSETKVDQEGFDHVKDNERYLWVELFNMVHFDLVIIDEGHYIKNIGSQRSNAVRQIKAERIIFLTGTPVINRPGELWPMLTMLAPDQFPFFETFLRQYTYDGKHVRNSAELHTVLKPLMLRRLKKDVIKELPPINRIVQYRELSDKAKKLYNKALEGLYEEVAMYNPKNPGAEKEISSILVQIMRLKQICAFSKADDTAMLATEIYDESVDSEAEVPNKVIIFTQFKPVAYGIYTRLKTEGALCFVTKTRKGFETAGIEERQALVDKFQSDPSIHFLIVTEKTTKEGMNITAAQSVIFNDLFWTPAGHDQAEGRAYGRLSDLHSINSHYMVCDNTIENWIQELLIGKQAIIGESVDNIERSKDESIFNELMKRLREQLGK